MFALLRMSLSSASVTIIASGSSSISWMEKARRVDDIVQSIFDSLVYISLGIHITNL